MTPRNFILLIFLALTLASCTQSEARKRVPPSKGLPSELLIVVDKAVWESDIADTLRVITECDVPGLMQHESFFRTSHVMTEHLSRTFTTMHSKLYVRLNPTLKSGEVGVARDVSARPQIEVVVEARDLAQLRSLLSRSGEYIRDIIADFQLELREADLRRKHSSKVDKDLRSVLGMTMCAPPEIIATKKGKDFLWGGSNLNEKDLNVVVYTFPATAIEAMNAAVFVQKRDSVMAVNIPGSQPDQWMETVREKGVPIVSCRTRKLDGEMVLEACGLWQMRNGALGGPFVSLTRYDAAHLRAIVAEGFVYSPSTDKRELIRTVEAAIRTVKAANTTSGKASPTGTERP